MLALLGLKLLALVLAWVWLCACGAALVRGGSE